MLNYSKTKNSINPSTNSNQNQIKSTPLSSLSNNISSPNPTPTQSISIYFNYTLNFRKFDLFQDF
jgi:hypothetical protein